MSDIEQGQPPIRTPLHLAIADGQHAVILTDYEIANLREALSAAYSDGPLNALWSGDWAGQVLDKLPMVDHWVCQSAKAMMESAKTRQEPITDDMAGRLLVSFAQDQAASAEGSCPTPQEQLARCRRALEAALDRSA